MLIIAFMDSGRLRLQAAFNIGIANQASYVAESAINLATLALLTQREAAPTGETVYDGTPKFCALDRALVALAVEDEAGKIDLNAARPELLQAALLGLGLSERKAQEAASAIVAFRKSSTDATAQMNSTRAGGGKPTTSKERLFETIMELDQVSGIDPTLFRALLPLVTVHSKTAGIDARSSPPALFAALSGFPVKAVRALAVQPYPNDLNRSDPRFPANFNERGSQSAFLIYAEVRLATGQTIAREAILDLRPPSGKQFAIREIRRGQSRYADRLRAIIAANGAGVPDC
jgi:general secretion pathway protein K